MSKKAKNRTNKNFLPGLEDFDPSMIGGIENDPSLEAELLELIGGGGNPGNKIDKPKKKDIKPIPIDNNLLNLDLNDNDNVSDVDENDPDLLAELNSFLNEDSTNDLPVKKNVSNPPCSDSINKLENLKKSYQEAIKQAANDPSKLRRFKRSLDLIEQLLKKASSGLVVDESEFPPVPVLTTKIDIPKETISQLPLESPPKKSPKLQPQTETASLQQKSQLNSSSKTVVDALINRQTEYKHAALQAKQNGDLQSARGFMRIYKQFDEVIQMVKNGEQFDLEGMPPHPSECNLAELEQELELPEEPPSSVVVEKPKIISSSLGEELKIRQSFYKESVDKAKSEGNDSKARRLNRLVQQYEEAITAFKKNQFYPYEELPPPPGTQPLTNQQNNQQQQQPIKLNPVVPQLNNPPKQLNILSKNTKILLERQAQFKSAALKAKQDGDLPLAKELLKQSKGFDQMIEAAKSGFPINMSSLPSLPTEPDYNNYELINIDECEIPAEMMLSTTVDKDTLFKQLQVTLMEQMGICSKYEKLNTKAGDIITARRFESLQKSCEKDLSGLKCLIQKKADLPKFHYEYKIFSVLQSNPELGETEMTVDLIKGINFSVPPGFTGEQLDTYVILELPFPNDSFQTFTSETIKHTANPIFNAQFKFQVNIKSRVFQRVVKSKQLKADIYYKKGFLQKDKLLGTSGIKLEKLETQCTIHETFDIYENRKLIGGKLELKIRIRNPLSGGNQTENVKEKWLVIDDFNQKNNIDLSTVVGGGSGGGGGSGHLDQSLLSASIDVLKFEIGDLKKMLIAIGNKMSSAQMNSVKQKIQEKELAARKQEEKLKSSDPSIRLQYLQSISKLPQEFHNEAKKFLSENNRDKANFALTKKKLVEKEIERLKDSRNKN